MLAHTLLTFSRKTPNVIALKAEFKTLVVT